MSQNRLKLAQSGPSGVLSIPNVAKSSPLKKKNGNNIVHDKDLAINKSQKFFYDKIDF